MVETENEQLLFVQPHETTEPFTKFLHYVQQDSTNFPERTDGYPVKYAQTQNDNLREEYHKLLPDVPSDIPFARIALEKQADAINLWIGNERSVTALHKDNYENIYVQVRGKKHFVLLSPVEMPCVNEQPLEQARYVPKEEHRGDDISELVVERSPNSETLPFATWDPDEPDFRTTAFSSMAKPLRVTLDEGDMVYLPAM